MKIHIKTISPSYAEWAIFSPPFHALPGMNDGVGDVIMSVCRRYSSLIFPPKKSPSTHPFIMINWSCLIHGSIYVHTNLSTKKRARSDQNWQEARAVSVIKTSINWLQGKVSKRPTKEPCAWRLEPSDWRINGIQISVPTSYKDIHQPFGLSSAFIRFISSYTSLYAKQLSVNTSASDWSDSRR